MISINTIRDYIESALNSLSQNEFKIFCDVGEFKKAYKPDDSNNIYRYINGIMEVMSPTRLPIKNLEISTQSFRVAFVADMDLLNKDDNGEYIEVQIIRNLLEKLIANNNGLPFYKTEEGKSFEITPTFSGITVGQAQQMSPIGNVLPIYLDFSCVFVENGTNTNTVDFIINGENMFYQEYSITRTRTAETNMIAGEPSSKTLAQANGISLQLKMPLLNTDQSKAIESDVWNGTQNEAICVERIRHIAGEHETTIENAYIMIYGNNAETGNIGQNIGQVVDFVEGKQHQLKYGEKWSNTAFTAVSGTMSTTQSLPAHTSDIVVFWGDGTTNRYGKTITTATHTYSQEGNYTIRFFVY